MSITELSPSSAHHPVTRREWQIANVAMHGLSEDLIQPPIEGMDDPRVEHGSWKDFGEEEFGTPKTAGATETQAATQAAQEALKMLYPEFQARFKKGVETGIAQGYIPGYVARRVDEALYTTPVRVIATTREYKKGDTKAFYDEYDDTFGVVSDAVNPGLMRSLIHEGSHKISGGTFAPKKDAFAGHRRIRIGYGAYISQDNYTKMYTTEAINEHLTGAILDGDFETIDPTERQEDEGGYNNIRKMLSVFIDKSQGIIDPKTFIKASFEDSGPEGVSVERRELVRQIRTAYGRGAFRKLEKLHEAVYDYKENPIDIKSTEFQKIADRITPPVLDEAGNVIQQGSINIEGL